ncbi:unnamed protein product [Arabis nemorensis]|uniref:Uncharacterized protein n=1 Tax=Arabis nemorensis TaxID=586526 RepID=A0A565CW53_9BRAS|nr:unnamed protein product [Arabis nemorensis]
MMLSYETRECPSTTERTLTRYNQQPEKHHQPEGNLRDDTQADYRRRREEGEPSKSKRLPLEHKHRTEDHPRSKSWSLGGGRTYKEKSHWSEIALAGSPTRSRRKRSSSLLETGDGA